MEEYTGSALGHILNRTLRIRKWKRQRAGLPPPAGLHQQAGPSMPAMMASVSNSPFLTRISAVKGLMAA